MISKIFLSLLIFTASAMAAKKDNFHPENLAKVLEEIGTMKNPTYADAAPVFEKYALPGQKGMVTALFAPYMKEPFPTFEMANSTEETVKYQIHENGKDKPSNLEFKKDGTETIARLDGKKLEVFIQSGKTKE